MREITISFCILIACLLPSQAADREIPSDLSNWIVTNENIGFSTSNYYAANRVGTVWEVYKKDKVLKVREYFRGDADPMIKVSGGKLSCNNRGEFGSTVYWEPDGDSKVELTHDHVRQFLTLSSQVFAVSGIAHMGTNIGEVLKFDRVKDVWKISQICKLPDEPQIIVPETAEAFLVLTYSGLCRVSVKGWIQLIVISAPWTGLHPRSLVIGEDGFAYVGFSQRVAKINLKTGDATYLIPHKEIFEDDLKADSK